VPVRNDLTSGIPELDELQPRLEVIAVNRCKTIDRKTRTALVLLALVLGVAFGGGHYRRAYAPSIPTIGPQMANGEGGLGGG